MTITDSVADLRGSLVGNDAISSIRIGQPCPETPPPPVDPAAAIAGVYDGVHRHWRDAVHLSADGTFRRGNGDPGRYTFDGKTLVLRWNNWGPETLEMVAPGRFQCRGYLFTLNRR
jgi:hypothetical protein